MKTRICALILLLMCVFLHAQTESMTVTSTGDVEISNNLTITKNLNVGGNIEVAGELPLPKGYISGLEIEATVKLSTQAIKVSPGVCRTDNNNLNISLVNPISTTVGLVWPFIGSSALLFGTGFAATSEYYVFLLCDEINDIVVLGIDDNTVCNNIPEGYSSYKYLGSIATDSTGIIIPDSVKYRHKGYRNTIWEGSATTGSISLNPVFNISDYDMLLFTSLSKGVQYVTRLVDSDFFRSYCSSSTARLQLSDDSRWLNLYCESDQAFNIPSVSGMALVSITGIKY